MKKVRHSKIKNTGILYELLVRQISTDVIAGNDSQALHIVKEYFGKGSEIFKELELYQTLVNVKFNSPNKANALVEAVTATRTKLNNKQIRSQKYRIIKAIQESYNVNDFFSSEIPNYKVFASVYKLFENAISADIFDPTDLAKSKVTLAEHISSTGKTKIPQKSSVIAEYEKQPEDVRLITTKLLVDNFNEKYRDFSPKQKSLLREYINNVAHSLRRYVNAEIPGIKTELTALSKKVDDRVVTIKLHEVIKQLDKLTKGRDVKDEQVSAILSYYQLIDELKRV